MLSKHFIDEIFWARYYDHHEKKKKQFNIPITGVYSIVFSRTVILTHFARNIHKDPTWNIHKIAYFERKNKLKTKSEKQTSELADKSIVIVRSSVYFFFTDEPSVLPLILWTKLEFCMLPISLNTCNYFLWHWSTRFYRILPDSLWNI